LKSAKIPVEKPVNNLGRKCACGNCGKDFKNFNRVMNRQKPPELRGF